MDIKKLLDEQKHLCQTEFDKRSVLIDGVWFVACEDILKAPYPKQLNLCVVGVKLPTKEQMVSELERLTANKFVNNRNESIQYIFGFNACFDWLKNKLKDNGN